MYKYFIGRVISLKNKLYLSFNGKSKFKSFPSKVLVQVMVAVLVSFFLHIPFFLDKSGAGTCNYHKNVCEGKFFLNRKLYLA